MAEQHESDASRPSDTDTFPAPAWCAEQWDVLCDVLGASDPEQVVPRVRTLKEQLDRIDAEAERAAPDGLVTISEVEEVFQEMQTKLKRLRERNAALVEQLDNESDTDADAAMHALHAEVDDLLHALGVNTVDEAEERIDSLQQQLDTLYEEKEDLVEAGWTSAEEALDEIDRLQSHADRVTRQRDTLREQVTALEDERDALQDALSQARNEHAATEEEWNALRKERDALQDERDALRAERDRLSSDVDALTRERDGLRNERDRLRDERPDESLLRSVEAMRSILGLSTPDEARALARSVRKMKERLDALSAVQNRLASQVGVSDPDDLVAMIENMEQQLIDLYQDREKGHEPIPESIVQTLGVSNAKEANELARVVRRMDEQLRTLSSQHERLSEETGLDSAEDVLTMIENMEQQLVHLYQEREHSDDALPASVVQTLGVSNAKEADELVRVVQRMDEQLRTLSSQHERLSEETGLDSAEDVLTMIQTLEDQLVDLYQEREAADNAGTSSSLSDEIIHILGVSTPQEARELNTSVRRMGERLATLSSAYEKVTADIGMDSADDTQALIESMEAQLVDLYQTVEAQHMGPADDAPSSDVGAVLGISTAEEARELEALVHDITGRLETLTQEQEKLRDRGLGSVDGAIAMIESMEQQLIDLYERQEEANGPAPLPPVPGGDASPTDASSRPSPSASPSESPPETVDRATYQTVIDLLGVESVKDAEQLSAMVHTMSEQMDRLATEHQKLLDVGLSVEHALSMIESMEEQLVDLYKQREGDSAASPLDASEEADHNEHPALTSDDVHPLAERLGFSDLPTDATPAEHVDALTDHVDDLLDRSNELLHNAGQPASASIDQLLQRMEEQLVELHHERNTLRGARKKLDAIRDVLGIETRDEAEELAAIAQNMNDQLQTLQAERERLQELGVSSIPDAVDMVASMEAQLQELYKDKENVQQRSQTDAFDPNQDTFQQLETLYAEQEKLERELGVSSADSIIEMVEGLAAQLSEFYTASEGHPYDASLDEAMPDQDAGAAPAPGLSTDDDTDLMLLSMQEQLEALYREKELLFEQGMGDVEEAISRIQTLEGRLHRLERERDAHRKNLQDLKNEVGTTSLPKVVKRIRSLKERVLQRPEREGTAGTSREDAAASEGSSSDDADTLTIHAAPRFADPDTLSQLGALSSHELDALPYGVIRLSNEGRVEFVNEAGLQLPGLKEADDRTTLIGKNFFLDLAPSTKNNLFLGRFKQGLQKGAMDARFPYTFISPGRAPKVLTVHLYRKPHQDVNWLLFRPM